MKKRTLKKELIILMIATSACTLFSVCAAMLYVFFSFFVENTREDIAYVLNSTNEQFRTHVQFIEDGAISIRHNTMLNSFFEAGENDSAYDSVEIEQQLSYSMELFSERNMIDRQIPFVTGVYLFNNRNDCVYEHYYKSTIASEAKQESQYRNLQQIFKKNNDRFGCVTDENNINLIFRIYDDDMQEKGICIAAISRWGMNQLLNGITDYSESTWLIVFGEDRVIASRGKWEDVEQLVKVKSVWRGTHTLKKGDVIGCADVCGFDIRSVIAVGEENVFSVLNSTMVIFAVGLAFVLVITVLVAFTISYRFTKPITRMIESIRAFGKLNFDVRMKSSSIQEIHDISMVFNEMADRIRYLIMQVYEKQLLATRSQMKYLQAQINPHFQFNILAMLSLKAKMGKNEEVYEGLQAFSKLIQGKIFREKEIKIKVSEELEIVYFYLYLQKSRYQDKISYEIKVEDEKINQYLIPRLLIEPLVENAVSHGLEPKREKGMIKVCLFERDFQLAETEKEEVTADVMETERMLHICVEDDGVGFDTDIIIENSGEEQRYSEQIGHTHTGLENIKRMLQILYGEEYAFHISGGKGKGTKIEIVLPVEEGIICGK